MEASILRTAEMCEPGNLHDRYAVAVLKEGIVVGHFPAILYLLFLRKVE